MLDIKYLKSNKEEAMKALSKRVPDLDLEALLALDEEVKRITSQYETLQAEKNTISKKIGQLKSNGTDTTDFQNHVTELNVQIAALSKQAGDLNNQLQEQLDSLPNLPDPRVPSGGKESNKVVKVHGDKPEFSYKIKDHVQLCTDLKLVDYERGVKLGGSGFWLYTGLGAALEWALLNYFCAEHYKDGYKFILPPHLLVYECGYAAGQFPKFEEDVFHLRHVDGYRERFLLPTSETAILNVFRDEIIDENDLPIKAFAYSPCYRSEAGGPRTEERGTIRGHQFNKVEMFQFTKPEQSEDALNELVARAERLMESLGLHYQTSLLAAQDASAAMAMTYDVEVWIPSIGIYKEVSSISWARDYQARRAKIRFKRKGEKNTEFVHTLNASGLATSRLLPAIVEQNQQEDGSVKVPKPLQPWLGVDIIKPVS
jgi:seryl-tRNA synthetase